MMVADKEWERAREIKQTNKHLHTHTGGEDAGRKFGGGTQTKREKFSPDTYLQEIKTNHYTFRGKLS